MLSFRKSPIVKNQADFVANIVKEDALSVGCL